MRQDQQVHDLIRDKRAIERNSACCVRNDRSGCVQTSEEECSVRSLAHAFCERSEQPNILFFFFLDVFFLEHASGVGEVAAAFQHPQVERGGERSTARLRLPSGSQVRRDRVAMVTGARGGFHTLVRVAAGSVWNPPPSRLTSGRTTSPSGR